MRIGVFDSGLGGLTILKAIIKQLPKYDYLYLGDNARVPYGGRSAEIIYQFTRQAVEFLFKNNCQLVILACNSATANALRRLQQEYLPHYYPSRRILGIIKPTIEYLLEKQAEKVGLLGTYATVESGAYQREIFKVLPKTNLKQQACPLLVPLIEENAMRSQAAELILQEYLESLKKYQPKVLLLACTHYGLIKEQAQRVVGKNTVVVDQGELVAKKLQEYLNKHPEIKHKLSCQKSRVYYATDLNERFSQMAKLFMAGSLRLQKIVL